jgi:hypothetical protein
MTTSKLKITGVDHFMIFAINRSHFASYKNDAITMKRPSLISKNGKNVCYMKKKRFGRIDSCFQLLSKTRGTLKHFIRWCDRKNSCFSLQLRISRSFSKENFFSPYHGLKTCFPIYLVSHTQTCSMTKKPSLKFFCLHNVENEKLSFTKKTLWQSFSGGNFIIVLPSVNEILSKQNWA